MILEVEARFRHISFEPATDPRTAVARPKPRHVPALHGSPTGWHKFAAELAPPQPVVDEAHTDLMARALAAYGLDLRHYRITPLLRRIPACLRALHVRTVADALRLLDAKPQALAVVADALLIGVTSFFRDSGVFEQMRELVIPRLGTTRPPAVWSVGCSSGAELYSVGMLLAEAGKLIGSELLGTDCRPKALKAARDGKYAAALFAGAPEELVGQYFAPAADGHLVGAEQLRSKIRWEQADLLACADRQRWDLVLCRNVAIYLKETAAARLWQRLAEALRPGGFLITGKAEQPIAQTLLRKVAPCIYSLEG